MLKSGNRFKQLTLTASGYSRDTENFSRLCGKGDIVKHLDALAVHTVDIFNHKPFLRVFRLGPFYIKRDFFAHHHFGKL